MTDRFLPTSATYGKPCGSGPASGANGEARIDGDQDTPVSGNFQAQPSIVLPWPPSNNTYYAVVRGRKILSAKGREYREAVKALATEQRWPNFNRSRLRIEFEAWMPDRRRRDLDNLLKGLCDSLTHAGVWHDDEQIDDLRIYRAPLVGGMVKVRVSAMEQS